MNKNVVLLFAALMLLLSCSREVDHVIQPGETITFTAGWAGTEDTRTILQSDGTSVWWEPGAQINVFFGDKASGRFTSTNSQAQAIVDFTGSLPIVVGSVETENPAHAYWAVYPYDSANTCDGESVTLTIPSTQTAAEGTFANKMFPSIAMSTNFYLAFYNICGGVRFTVANEGISSVTFKASNGESLVGKVQVGFASAPVIKKVTEGSTEITVNAPEGGFIPGKNYFATILPQTLSKGVTLTFKKTNGTVASTSIDNAITVNRSRFGTMTDKDKGLVFQGEVPVSSIELSQTSVQVRVGESVTLVATVKPDDATDKTVVWTSSNDAVATVDYNGKVTGIGEGSTTITAKAGEETATCGISVLPANFNPNGEYLSFTGLVDGSGIWYEGSHTATVIEYSYDTITWYDWIEVYQGKYQGMEIGLDKGTQVFVRGTGRSNDFQFKMKGLIAANGNIMSLVYGLGDFSKEYALGVFKFKGLFENCTSLAKAPDLPATELRESCYEGMFAGCTSLTSVPDLPATVLPPSCYAKMFRGCTSLTDAPAILADIASDKSCLLMFENCTSLTNVPDLTIKTLGAQCYQEMFKGCTGLTRAPAILTNTLAPSCCYWMFYGCTSLTEPPSLQATSLAEYCYTYMFQNCTSLTTAPELPATTLADNCYAFMFLDCTNLIVAPELPAMTLASGCYCCMFYGCTSLTEPPVLPATTLASGCYDCMFGYCQSLTSAPELPTMALAESCYSNMFSGCTSLTKAPELPATTLAGSCYSKMFSGCTSLTMAPELPATTLAGSCYSNMFLGCYSLTKAPDLPATTLANSCYYSMFYNCTSLIDAPDLPASTLAESCYEYMFYGCTNLSTAPEKLPATTLASSCYRGMFVSCRGLTRAPVLPATTLAPFCYSGMFSGCNELSYVKMMATNILTVNTTDNFLAGVSDSGVFVKNVAATWNEDKIIPSGWTVITATE